MELNEARDAIKRIDEEMAELFVRRMEAVREVAAYKRAHGLPIEDKEQEAKVIEGRSALIADPELRSFYVRYLRETIEVSKSWQHRLFEGLRVAYSGVEGAFAHVASQRIFPDGTPVAYPSFEAAYAAVEAGECDVAVLPIENSFAGEVGQVLDLMFSGGLFVNGVYDLSVTHKLLGVPGANPSDV
ncbi:MAG: chorismate mutase, partial [Clostridia bacterium]|nr:chorismate mutase [Clostridia bacterium]